MHLNSQFKLVHIMTIQNWWTTRAEGRNLCVSSLEHVPPPAQWRRRIWF